VLRSAEVQPLFRDLCDALHDFCLADFTLTALPILSPLTLSK
jgi:hypothetical protein